MLSTLRLDARKLLLLLLNSLARKSWSADVAKKNLRDQFITTPRVDQDHEPQPKEGKQQKLTHHPNKTIADYPDEHHKHSITL